MDLWNLWIQPAPGDLDGQEEREKVPDAEAASAAAAPGWTYLVGGGFSHPKKMG